MADTRLEGRGWYKDGRGVAETRQEGQWLNKTGGEWLNKTGGGVAKRDRRGSG